MRNTASQSQECEDFGVPSYAGTNTGLEIKHETRSMESQRPDCAGKKGGFTFCLRSSEPRSLHLHDMLSWKENLYLGCVSFSPK